MGTALWVNTEGQVRRRGTQRASEKQACLRVPLQSKKRKTVNSITLQLYLIHWHRQFCFARFFFPHLVMWFWGHSRAAILTMSAKIQIHGYIY